MHKLPDALVEGDTVTDKIGTRAERGANALLIDWRPFSKLCGSAETEIGPVISSGGRNGAWGLHSIEARKRGADLNPRPSQLAATCPSLIEWAPE